MIWQTWGAMGAVFVLTRWLSCQGMLPALFRHTGGACQSPTAIGWVASAPPLQVDRGLHADCLTTCISQLLNM